VTLGRRPVGALADDIDLAAADALAALVTSLWGFAAAAAALRHEYRAVREAISGLDRRLRAVERSVGSLLAAFEPGTGRR
jgi:hypothetical protein